MGFVNTSDLRPGQVFSEPVYSEGNNLLVPAMAPLRQKEIDLLLSWGIDAVQTDGYIVEAENVSEIEEEEIHELEQELEQEQELEPEPELEQEPEPEPEQEDEVIIESKRGTINFSISAVRQNSGPYRAYKNLIEKLNAVFTELKSGNNIEMRAIDNICLQLLQDLRNNPESFVGFILGGEVMGHELAKSSVNTAILSALIAQELHLPHHKINNIVAGALLHDVGMLRLSRGITEKKGGLSDAELEQIKSHPIHTSKIVTKELFGPHEVNLIALQHHERWDGQGYPDHLLGPAIDIGARIVSVADAFEAMVSKKSYRNPMGGYQAIKNLLADNSRRFDPAVIKEFTKIMGIYPIGSIVRLNKGSVARVVSVHINAPLRPVIQILMDENGRVINSRELTTIDLLEEKTMFIKEAIDPAEFDDADE